MNFQRLLDRIGSDWGATGFHDEQSGKFIRITVTYDHDCVWEVFDSGDVRYDEEIDSIEIIGSKEPLVRGYFDPADEFENETPDPDEEERVWNKHLTEILEEARKI